MRIAALYDIHSNLPALGAVLQEVEQCHVDRIVVGGDVLPGPMPRESLDLLAGLPVPVDYIRGNGDREVLAQLHGEPLRVPESVRETICWTASRLLASDAVRIAAWPPTLELTISPFGRVLFCHATPQSDTAIFSRLTPEQELQPLFQQVSASIVICGHTHMPFDRTVGRTRILNAGSVGMPFGRPGADWLLLGPEIEFRHTEYDLSAAAAAVCRTTYPGAETFAATNILHPPSEEAMLAAFTRISS